MAEKRGSRNKATAKKATAKKQASNPNQTASSRQPAPATIRLLFIEDTTGEQYEASVPAGTLLNQLANDFFETRGWDTHDSQGRAQRAVVDEVVGTPVQT